MNGGIGWGMADRVVRGGVHMDLCGIVGVGVRMADDDVMIP